MIQSLFRAGLIVACTYALSPSANPSSKHYSRADASLQHFFSAEDASTTPTSPDETLVDLPPVIQQIADERRDFQVNLGKAMDTLRKDMPEILKQAPGEK